MNAELFSFLLLSRLGLGFFCRGGGLLLVVLVLVLVRFLLLRQLFLFLLLQGSADGFLPLDSFDQLLAALPEFLRHGLILHIAPFESYLLTLLDQFSAGPSPQATFHSRV